MYTKAWNSYTQASDLICCYYAKAFLHKSRLWPWQILWPLPARKAQCSSPVYVFSKTILQVWEFDLDHQRWSPVAELASAEDKGEQVYAVAWAPNIGRYNVGLVFFNNLFLSKQSYFSDDLEIFALWVIKTERKQASEMNFAWTVESKWVYLLQALWSDSYCHTEGNFNMAYWFEPWIWWKALSGQSSIALWSWWWGMSNTTVKPLASSLVLPFL